MIIRYYKHDIYQIRKLLISLVVFFFYELTFGQSIEPRIKEIYKMKAEVDGFIKTSPIGKCKITSTGNYNKARYDYSGRKVFKEATNCNYSNNYSKLTYAIDRWEWAEYYEFFYKNEKLFFAYYINYTVSGEIEYKFYYDTKGKVIKTEVRNDLDMDEDVKKKMENDMENEIGHVQKGIMDAKSLLKFSKK